jgi:hypothetical protein
MAKTATKKATAKKPAPATRRRSAAKLTITQTRMIEGQFDTFANRGTSLAGKLVDIEAKWDDKEAFVPAKVSASRAKLAEALILIDEAKAEFAEIGDQYRSFFG